MELNDKQKKVLRNITLHYDGDMYVAEHNDNSVKLTKFLYELLSNIKESSFEATIEKYSKEKGLIKEEANLIFNRLITLLETLSRNSSTGKYIFFRRKIFKESLVNRIAAWFTFLFHKKVIIILFPISILITTIFFFQNSTTIFYAQPFGVLELVLYYISILLILFFHEFGHASASKSYNIRPREIGFGIYFIFPVLYSNVSGIWVLSKFKRIVVNLGGIYFQFILNVILVGLYYLLRESPGSQIISLLLIINTFISLYSLFPFVRNDGYWVYSDSFNILNLNKQSTTFLMRLLSNIFLNKKTIEWEKKTIWLGIYSIGNHAFKWFLLLRLMPSFIDLLKSLSQASYSASISQLFIELKPHFLKSIVVIVIFGFLIKSVYEWGKVNLLDYKLNVKRLKT